MSPPLLRDAPDSIGLWKRGAQLAGPVRVEGVDVALSVRSRKRTGAQVILGETSLGGTRREEGGFVENGEGNGSQAFLQIPDCPVSPKKGVKVEGKPVFTGSNGPSRVSYGSGFRRTCRRVTPPVWVRCRTSSRTRKEVPV